MCALTLVTGFGLSAAVGLNLTLPILLVAVLARTGNAHLAPAFSFLGSNGMLALLAVLASIEMVVDKGSRRPRGFHVALLPLAVGAAVMLTAAFDMTARDVSGLSLVLLMTAAAGAAGAVHVLRTWVRPPIRLLGGSLPLSWGADVAAVGIALSAILAPLLLTYAAGAFTVLALQAAHRLVSLGRTWSSSLSDVVEQWTWGSET